MIVDGEEGLLEEDNPLALFVLRLVKDGLHLLHVARSVAVHLLQDFLIASTDLEAFGHNNQGLTESHSHSDIVTSLRTTTS